MKTFENNLTKLQNISDNCNAMGNKQLALLNKLRSLNDKQLATSFEHHKQLKKLGL